MLITPVVPAWSGQAPAAPRSDATPSTLQNRLLRDRLELRARRLELVVAALRDREEARAAVGPVPAPLREATGSFVQELAHVRRQIAATSGPLPVRPRPRRR